MPYVPARTTVAVATARIADERRPASVVPASSGRARAEARGVSRASMRAGSLTQKRIAVTAAVPERLAATGPLPTTRRDGGASTVGGGSGGGRGPPGAAAEAGWVVR